MESNVGGRTCQSRKKIVLWRTEVENKPGTLASTIGPPARLVRLKVSWATAPTAGGRRLEIFPITGKKPTAAAVAAGLSAAALTYWSGRQQAGFGLRHCGKVAAAGSISPSYGASDQPKFAAVIGFETDDDAKKAAPLIKKAATGTKADEPRLAGAKEMWCRQVRRWAAPAWPWLGAVYGPRNPQR